VTRILLWTLAALLIPLPVAAQEDAGENTASALVTTVVPAQGLLAQPVTAYGALQAAPSGTVTVSTLHAAQIVELHVVAGQAVGAGDPLIDLAPDPAAALAYAQAESDLKLAEGELARTRQMLAERLATNSQVEQAAKAAKDAEATLQARIREGGNMAKATLSAPVDGTVTAISASNGDHVQPGAALVTLVTARGAVGVFGIPPQALALVKPGQTVQLADLDLPAQPVGATVQSVGNVADPKTGLFTVVVGIPDRNSQALTVGTHLRATIATAPVAGWIVPRGSVLTDEKGGFAYQVADGKAVRVPVVILAGTGDRLAVSGALDPKKKLVVAGSYQLSDGMPVREQSDKAPTAPASK
jgi:RND family efflux transporter MFP subunit